MLVRYRVVGLADNHSFPFPITQEQLADQFEVTEYSKSAAAQLLPGTPKLGCITATFAPPCNGPESAQMPADIEVNKLAALEPTMRTVEVEQFCSWSAWSSNTRLRAFATSGTAM